jgi:LAS superfamily LD-carboxypeptidase LdcB
MAYREPARTATRRMRVRKLRVACVLAVVATGAVLGYRLLPSSASTAPSPTTVASPAEAPRSEYRDALGEAGGAVPDGTSVFDDEVPGVAKLDPALLNALRRAATDAAGNGVAFVVDSGWRSAAYQERLLRESVAEHGSEREAARWVATPNTSAHVSGDAVDIGPPSAAAWLSAHGGAYGLCQIYRNEPWHYELRSRAVGHGCPPMYADPTQDPRMRQ